LRQANPALWEKLSARAPLPPAKKTGEHRA
jgi:hypothetical protein